MITKNMMHMFAQRAVKQTVAKNPHNNPLDFRFGMALVRDRRVPVKSKLFAFALGIGLMALLVALEIPLESILTVIAPILTPFEFAIDGIELIALPVLFTALFTAFVAPRTLVDSIRAERFGLPVSTNEQGDVIDIKPVSA